MERLPIYKIHSGKGAAQLNLLPASYNGKSFTLKNGPNKGRQVQEIERGCLMIEMAPLLKRGQDGNNQYDWQNKVTMKLVPVDIQTILKGLREGDSTIIHQPGKARGTNTNEKSFLNVKKGQQYGYSIWMTRGQKKARVNITSEEEANTLRLLLQRAIVRMYGW